MSSGANFEIKSSVAAWAGFRIINQTTPEETAAILAALALVTMSPGHVTQTSAGTSNKWPRPILRQQWDAGYQGWLASARPR
jgi:hypothetical protein